ncbi:MAG: FHA domain-containing protein [Oscillospiraceae bacterium]|nr:FHA domain-containing protein [Oscillospiraceae bacterium]MBR0393441.1 FHA domain-containing protein [Oscillospiraceae bacterium]
MAFGSKKNQNNNFVESYGKTEPVPGGEFMGGVGGFGNDMGGVAIDGVSKTMPATSGLIDTDVLFGTTPPAASGGGFEEYGKTVPAQSIMSDTGETVLPVVGWLVCIRGVNIGKEFRIHSDYNYVGSVKGDIVIPGDAKISKEDHMLITYDSESRSFYVSPAKGANIIRLNDKGLVAPAELKNYDVIRTGDSTFVFIGFCGEQFNWENDAN